MLRKLIGGFSAFLAFTATILTTIGLTSAANCDGDLNNDLKIDILDYHLFKQDFLKSSPALQASDIDSNGQIDLFDYHKLFKNFGQPCTSASSPLPAYSQRRFGSPWTDTIPSNAQYTKIDALGTIRPHLQSWAIPIVRITTAQGIPLVSVANKYSSRVESWPIPRSAQPSSQNHSLVVYNLDLGRSYEMYDVQWTSDTTMRATGNVEFDLAGSGLSSNPNQRVNSAGFAATAGILIKEDFYQPTTQSFNPTATINHALSVSVHGNLVNTSQSISPAVGSGDTDSTGSLPLGTRLAIDKSTDLNSFSLHPLSRSILQAAQNYGMFIHGPNDTSQLNGKFVVVIGIEQDLVSTVFNTDHDQLVNQIQSEISTVISQTGIYQVSLNPSPQATPPASPPSSTESPNPLPATSSANIP